MNSAAEKQRRDGQRGQALVWVVVMLPLFLTVIGLAIDGGMLFSARRELQNVADAAALAGAQQVDLATYRASAGKTIVLDPAAARQVAAEYIALQGVPVSGTVEATPQQVTVTVQRSVPTGFLRLVGIGSVPVRAGAASAPRYGIAQGNR